MGLGVGMVPGDGTGTYTPPGVSVPAGTPDTGLLLRFTTAATRTGSGALHGATVTMGTAEKVYAYASSTPGQDQVVFELDGTDIRTDSAAPFDAVGDDGLGNPLPLQTLSAGTHTLGARMRFGGGTSYTHPVATFVVVAGTGGGGGGTGGGDYSARYSPTVREALGAGSTGRESKWEALLGRQIHHFLKYGNRKGDIDDALTSLLAVVNDTGWRSDNWTAILNVPIVTDQARSTSDGRSLAYGANGGYDDIWDAFGTALAGLSDAQLMRLEVVLGWEGNGNWYAHGTGNSTNSGGDPALVAAWVTYIRRIVNRIRGKVGYERSRLLLMGMTFANPDMSTAKRQQIIDMWPGTDSSGRRYIDVVSVDAYTFNSGTTVDSFRSVLAWFDERADGWGTMLGIGETAPGAKQVIVSGDSWKSTAWSSTTTYTQASVVVHQNSIWRARTSTTGTEPGTNPAVWEPAYVYRGAWSSSTSYAKSNIVERSSQFWVAKVADLGTTPGTNEAVWTKAYTGQGSPAGDYPIWYDAINEWANLQITKKRLGAVILFEYDNINERLYTTVLAQQRTMPGREGVIIPGTVRVPNTPTNHPLSARKVLDLWG